MKTNILTALCVAAVMVNTMTQGAPPQDKSSGDTASNTSQPTTVQEHSPVAVADDALLARPMCFAATVVGSALFVVCLPFAALSHSVKNTARVLVVKPAKATFTRPLGDLDDLRG